jgi:hypothetical protein
MTNSPYTMRQTRVAYVLILGDIWMPSTTASLHKNLSDYDLINIGEFTRENVEQWLTSNSGDFQSVTDFYAVCGETEIPWSSEDNECAYLDTLPSED